jgi:hypothetical protein
MVWSAGKSGPLEKVPTERNVPYEIIASIFAYVKFLINEMFLKSFGCSNLEVRVKDCLRRDATPANRASA